MGTFDWIKGEVKLISNDEIKAVVDAIVVSECVAVFPRNVEINPYNDDGTVDTKTLSLIGTIIKGANWTFWRKWQIKMMGVDEKDLPLFIPFSYPPNSSTESYTDMYKAVCDIRGQIFETGYERLFASVLLNLGRAAIENYEGSLLPFCVM